MRKCRVSTTNPLSEALRQLRVSTGLSGAEAARRAGLSQSKVSRAETGTFVPAEDDVKALCRIYEASTDVRRELLAMTRELRENSTPARIVLQHGGWPMQQRIGKLESTASRIRDFSAGVVVGMIQIREYIEAMFGESLSIEDRDRAVRTRLDRQRLLDTKREFFVVMAEGALRWNLGGSAVMVAQLEHLVDVMETKPNVHIGVVPFTTPTAVPPANSFSIFDSYAVLIGTQSATALITDRRNIDDYENFWTELAPFVSWGDQARAVIERTTEDYRAIT
jgi:transcriptional regulator with XRE-family HTH domain